MHAKIGKVSRVARICVAGLAAGVLASCARSHGVASLGPDTYSISVTNAAPQGGHAQQGTPEAVRAALAHRICPLLEASNPSHPRPETPRAGQK